MQTKPLMLLAMVLGCLACSCSAAADALPAGDYTGAGQVMVLTGGEVRYGENLGICHIQIAADSSLTADFPGEVAPIHLQMAGTEPRRVWKATSGDKTFQATAIPFSPELYAFRLEILRDGKVIGGAQQFFALTAKQ